MAGAPHIDPLAKWQRTGSGEHYRAGRWRSARAAGRDPGLVAALLAPLALSPRARILDVPCGTGRLAQTLAPAGAYVGADVSPEMLAQGSGARVCASAAALPFEDASFELVVCCRLLHHVHDQARWQALADELVRVSSAWLLVSFWDAHSLPAWRKRHGLKRTADQRGAIAKVDVEQRLAQAGAHVVRYRHSFRFLSQQTFALARKEARP